jgi:hypothetical protein
MARLSNAQTVGILNAPGFRVRSTVECEQSLRVFKATWLHGTALAVDGDPEPLTSAALLLSETRRQAGPGTASEHSRYSEFTRKCGAAAMRAGGSPSCARCSSRSSS